MTDQEIRAKVIWHFLDISKLLQKYGDYICQQEGITVQQWLIMLYLEGGTEIPYFDRDDHMKPMLASELADALYVSRPNITNLVNVLLQKKLIVQVEDAEDRRRKRLQLAPAGRELLERLAPGRDAFNENLLGHLNADQLMSFLGMLEDCNERIIDHFEAVGHKG